jgi:hypothetical protein
MIDCCPLCKNKVEMSSPYGYWIIDCRFCRFRIRETFRSNHSAFEDIGILRRHYWFDYWVAEQTYSFYSRYNRELCTVVGEAIFDSIESMSDKMNELIESFEASRMYL